MTDLASLPDRVTDSSEPSVTVIIPVYNEEGTVELLSRKIAEVLDGMSRSFEIIFIDDGSTDGTAGKVQAAHAHDERVKLVRFRRNF